MERVEKVLLLAVLGVALMIVAVMSFLPDDVKADPKDSGEGVTKQEPAEGPGEVREVAGNGEGADPHESIAKLMGKTAPKDVTGGAESEGGDEVEGPREIEKDDVTGRPQKVADAPGPEKQEPDPAAKTEPAPEPTTTKTRVAMQYVGNPDYVQYVVKRGDTLSQILEDVCGSTSVMDEVIAVNEELNPQAMPTGYRLLIPKSALGAKPRAAAPRQPAGRVAGKSATTPERGAPGSELYTVQKGDSLWKIAAARVGKGKAQRYIARIQDLNPQARGTIRPGMKLRMPQ